MALKDRDLTPSDFRLLNTGVDPAMYVPESWVGKITDILTIKGPSFAEKLWAMSQFLNERYHRKYLLDCLVKTALDHGMASRPFLADKFQQLSNGLGSMTQAKLQAIHSAIGAELRSTPAKTRYSRILWGFYWATENTADPDVYGNDYKSWVRTALNQVVIAYNADPAVGWTMCANKLLAIIDQHP